MGCVELPARKRAAKSMAKCADASIGLNTLPALWVRGSYFLRAAALIELAASPFLASQISGNLLHST